MGEMNTEDLLALVVRESGTLFAVINLTLGSDAREHFGGIVWIEFHLLHGSGLAPGFRDRSLSGAETIRPHSNGGKAQSS